MAGSLEHITDEDGNFTMGCIDNMGDASEALEECFERMQRARLLLDSALLDLTIGYRTRRTIRAAFDTLERTKDESYQKGKAY